MKKILGKHYIIELIDCDSDLISEVSTVEKILVEAAVKSEATIINTHFHQFSPHGVSGVILIAESHFTIHTWPEEGHAAIDFFTCGDMLPEKAIEVFKKAFHSNSITIQVLDRGY